MVFPYDGSEIGVCPEDDIWDSFDLWSLNELNDQLYEMFDKLYPIKFAENYGSLVDILETIDKEKDLMSKKVGKYTKEFFTDTVPYFENDKPLLKVLDEFLDPEKNGFKLVKPRPGVFPSKPTSKEVWTSGKCVMLVTKPKIIEEFNERFR